MTDLDVPQAWLKTADAVRDEHLRTVVVLGAADIGKSAFCRVLSDRLIASGAGVAQVDADIGQKDIGPPAAVTLGYSTRAAEPTDTVPAAFHFVGSTSPAGRMLPLVVGAARLAGAADAPFVVVNTTGLIHGPGRALKQAKIEAIAIVAIERDGELGAIVAANRFRRIVRLAPSPAARAKSPEERKAARERAFGRYFAGARRQRFEVAELVIQGTLLFTGEPMSVEGALHAERTAEGPVVVAQSAAPAALSGRADTMRPGLEKHRLCGVADRADQGVGLAIFERIDFRGRTVSLFTPVPRERVCVLKIGDMFVGHDGKELGFVRVPRA